MADQDLPESTHAGSGRGKQIVFLFMSAVVVAVVIFLLGVSVGRGVRKNGAPTSPDENAAASDGANAASASTPPGADVNSVRAGAPADAPAEKPAAEAPAASTSSAPPPPIDEAPPSSKKDAPASTAKASATPPPSTAPTRKTGAQFFLQVGAYSTLAGAQKVVAQVKARDAGYSVSTLTLPDSAPPPRFKVMVGPYPTAEEARTVMARLKKQGFQTILKR